MIFAGVDNGITGAIVYLDESSTIIASTSLPVRSDGRKKRICIASVHKWMQQHGTPDFLMLERPAGSKSLSAAVSMADSFARLDTLFSMQKIPRENILARTWQKAFWTRPAGKKFCTKAAALLAASRLWPGKDFKRTARCRTPDSGLVDAALIAEHARRQRIGGL